jgi:TatD DNase family protein
MLLVDIHAHLEHPMVKDVDAVVKRAKDAGVKTIISSGYSPETNRANLKISKKYDMVKVSMGLYPDQFNIDVDKELEFIKKNDIAAVGECGLDFQEVPDHKEEQIELFRKQIKLAKELKLPLVVHTRKAEKECIDILVEENASDVILHSFCGSKKLIQRAIDLGYFLTITSNVVRAEQVQIKAEMTPLKQLLTETDTPFLGPLRDEMNEPANVKLAIIKIAKIKKIEPEECANIIFMNYKKLFG